MHNPLSANYQKYGPKLSTYDLAKFFAIVLMVIDHVGVFFYPEQEMFRAVGRWCVPIWLFLAGYSRPRRKKADIVILAAALIALDAATFNPIFPLNILVTILVSRWFLELAVRRGWTKRPFQLLAMLLVWWLPAVFFIDYGTLGPIYALAGYFVRCRRRFPHTPRFMAAATLAFIFTQTVLFGFDPMSFVVMITGVAFVSYNLLHFSNKIYATPVTSPARSAHAAAMFLGRNSLYFYTFHLAFLILLQRWFGSGLYIYFQ